MASIGGEPESKCGEVYIDPLGMEAAGRGGEEKVAIIGKRFSQSPVIPSNISPTRLKCGRNVDNPVFSNLSKLTAYIDNLGGKSIFNKKTEKKSSKTKWNSLKNGIFPNLSNLLNSIEMDVLHNCSTCIESELHQKYYERLDEFLSDGVRNIKDFRSSMTRNIYSPVYIIERFLAIYKRDVKTIWNEKLRSICNNADLNPSLDEVPSTDATAVEIEAFFKNKGNEISFPILPNYIIGSFSNLTFLDLSSLNLNFLPDSIGNLGLLDSLKLGGNKLIFLPDSIGNLRYLKELELDYNKLISLPKSIGNLKSLISLSLINNKLISLPVSIGNLESLIMLFLSDNRLSFLPDSIGNLEKLLGLHITNNQLRFLPKSIGNLSLLDWCDFTNNLLSFLPDSILKLNFQFLGLEINLLNSLPGLEKDFKIKKNIALSGNRFDKEVKQKIKSLYKEKLVLSGTFFLYSDKKELFL